MKKSAFLPGLILLVASHVAMAQERIFDVHVHLWEGETSLQEYLRQAKGAGFKVDRIGAIHGGNHMARHGKLAETRAHNDELLALAKAHATLMPIATVHPYDGDAAKQELERIAALGVRAIKLHPHTQGFDPSDPRVLSLCKRAGELGVVVLMDNANVLGGDSQALFNLALRAPRTHFVFNHLGALDFRFWNILPLAHTAKGLMSDNIHFDLSATVVLVADSPLEDEFVWTLRNVGIDNVLLGSDFPQLSLGKTLEALEKLDLTEEEKRKIRWENAERIFSAAKK
jgi:predicted TIM-barrel fold metal-dependent hydrolase